MAQSVKPADAGVSVGQVLQGKYRVEAILGHGGMGVVAECTHLGLNERYAIKMLRQDVLLDQDAVQRFVREAQAASKLKSEYVAHVSDVGTFENGVPYMVMEFLEGHDLGELLKQQGVLPVPWAVDLMLQTAEALAEAHSLGIVHRDVKPTNLFVTWRPDGTSLIKVLDFGISKSPMGTDMQLTQTQSLLGTPAYMSPEQMRSARLVDLRSDIWSLGTVMYEVIEGRRPFEAESFSEMCVKVAVDAPAPMVNTPPALQQVILKCIAKNPEQRYSHMAEFARDLVPFAPNQHQAQLLVERMTRLLRRSGFNIDLDTGRVPRDLADAGSGPVGAPNQWSVGSDPAANPWHGNTPPPRDPSQPFSRVLATDASGPAMTVNVRKSRWPLAMIAILLLGGAAAAGGYYLSTTGTHAAPPANAAATTEPATVTLTPTPPPPAPTAATEPAKPGTPADVAKPADGTPDTAATGSAADAAAKTDTAAKHTPAVRKPATGGHAAKAATRVETRPPAKTDATAAGDATVKHEPEKPKDPACDPFTSIHGCK